MLNLMVEQEVIV